MQKKYITNIKNEISFPIVCLLGIPLPILSEMLSVGGKSLMEYTYIFLVGYYIFSNDNVIDKLEKYKYISLLIGLTASILNVYMFIWSEIKYPMLNTITKFIAEWFMILALIGIGKKYLDFNGKISCYMSKRSFPFFSFHFIWVVLFQYLVEDLFAANTILLYIVPMILAYIATFICCEICIRVPLLSFLMGTKCISNNKLS